MKNHQSSIREYDRLAPVYDQRWAAYIDASVRATCDRLDVKPGESLLDVGCGTGLLLGRLKNHIPGARLTGLDASAGMLSQASARLGGSFPLVQGTADQLPFPSRSFDVVVSSSAFHYFPNPQQAVLEMARVLRPGGRLLITDWCRDYPAMRLLNRWLAWRDPAHYWTWNIRQLQRFLEIAKFENVRTERYRISAFWGLMSVQGNRPLSIQD